MGKTGINLMYIFILIMIKENGEAAVSDTLQECTDNAFTEGVVECFASKFEGILPFQQTPLSYSDKGFSAEQNTFTFHEPKDNVIRYNFIMPSITKRMTKSHHKMLDKLYDIGKAFVNKELEVLAIEKLKHINFQDIIYEYIVDIMNHIAPQLSHHASHFMTFTDTEVTNQDLCQSLCQFPSALCDACLQVTNQLPTLIDCLDEFTPEDFEDNIRWTKCFFNCEDLIPISSCMTEHFSQCGQWSIMSDLIIRGFADFTGLSDTCLVHVETPDNLTLTEGGDPTVVEFYTYMPPGALCVDFKGLSDPLAMFRAIGSLLGLLLGNSPECNVQIQMSMQNLWDDLIPHVDRPVIPTIGRPKCHDNRVAIRQAVIGNHEWASGTETCIINVTMENWNTSHSVPIWPSIDLKEDGNVNTTFTLKLVVDGSVKYNKKIPIIIEDKDPGQLVSLCQSTGDPHLITFDGHYYNNLYDGYFYLYRHKELPYQVQVVYQRCTPGGNASCTCAVSVKSGDDVFTVSKCRGLDSTEDPILKTVLYMNGDLTPGTRVFIKDEGIRFEVILPTGARADIVLNNGFLNVYLTPSTYDLGNSEGLCGVFDGDVTNDLTMPDGTVYTGPGSGAREQPREFSKAWRVPESERILTGSAAEASNGNSSAPFCRCNHVLLKGVQCTCGGGELVETCDINTDDEVANLSALMRRSEKSLQNSHDVDMDDIDWDENFEPPEINFNDNKVWNETYANSWCEAFIDSDEFVISCSNDRAIRNPQKDMAYWHCVDDIAITDSNAWQWAAVESIKKSCVSSYQREIDMANDTYTTIQNLCPNNCNGRGTCNSGSCDCEPTYTGGDCSVLSDHQPVVVMDSSSKCDKRHEDCQFATVYGRYFPSDDSLTCKVQQAEVDRSDGTFTATGDESDVDILYISPYQVVCSLPRSQSYKVTLEHSGEPLSVTHSSPQPYASNFIFMAYDSACYICDINTQSCDERETRNHCIIEEDCYASSDVNPDEECQYCNGTEAQHEWTWFTDDTCQKKKEEKLDEEEKAERDLIIRISVACILTALIVLLTVILFFRSKKKGRNYDEEDLDEFDTTDSPEKPKTENKASTEGVSNLAFDKEAEDKAEDQSAPPLQSPRLKEVQNMDPSLQKSPASRREKDILAAKQAAIERRKDGVRNHSTSSSVSNRSMGLGGGGSVAFSQYQHLAAKDGEEPNIHSSLEKGIGAHGTPPMTRRNLHSGMSVTTYF